ncbi:hypothetical protein [Ralstonia syzygii]|uniref:hypothetical protein n=1 Tax=Ralstonia syzygii TaxID=28097 RepID=UPI0018D0D6E6|nr:hypothetical protein [Ralstonia syzygii]
MTSTAWRGIRMPEDVAAEVGCLDSGDHGVFDDHVPHRRRSSEGAKWYPHLNEHMPRMRRTSIQQVLSQRLGNHKTECATLSSRP